MQYDFQIKKEIFIQNNNLKSKIESEEDYIEFLKSKLGNDYEVKSAGKLVHKSCGNEIWINRKHLTKLVAKNRLVVCPYCKNNASK